VVIVDRETGSASTNSSIPNRDLPWDCAIINWYAPDGFGPLGRESASLGWHRDLSERDHTLPIVTVSLGDACSWAVKVDEDEPAHRTRVESGQVTVLAGRMRLALHTVERIIPTPMFSPLKVRGRISVTLRVAG
jgi:alkylated DNA repair dioxygenase AlkB